MDGVTAALRLKELVAPAALPVLILTAHANTAEEARSVSGVGEAAHHYEKALGLAADPKVAQAAAAPDAMTSRARTTPSWMTETASLPSQLDQTCVGSHRIGSAGSATTTDSRGSRRRLRSF